MVIDSTKEVMGGIRIFTEKDIQRHSLLKVFVII